MDTHKLWQMRFPSSCTAFSFFRSWPFSKSPVRISHCNARSLSYTDKDAISWSPVGLLSSRPLTLIAKVLQSFPFLLARSVLLSRHWTLVHFLPFLLLPSRDKIWRRTCFPPLLLSSLVFPLSSFLPLLQTARIYAPREGGKGKRAQSHDKNPFFCTGKEVHRERTFPWLFPLLRIRPSEEGRITIFCLRLERGLRVGGGNIFFRFFPFVQWSLRCNSLAYFM